jgi:hypothetical protein
MGYKIAYDTMLNGREVTLYHESISINQDKTAMNVYKEWLTDDPAEARVFHTIEEVSAIACLFENKIKKPILIIE